MILNAQKLGVIHQWLLHHPEKSGAELAEMIRDEEVQRHIFGEESTLTAFLDLDVGRIHVQVDINVIGLQDDDEARFRGAQVIDLLRHDFEETTKYLNFIAEVIKGTHRQAERGVSGSEKASPSRAPSIPLHGPRP